MGKKKAVLCCCSFLFILGSLAAVIIPPIVIYTYELDPVINWTEVQPVDQKVYKHSSATKTVCVKALCLRSSNYACERSFSSFRYNYPPEKTPVTSYDSYHNSGLKPNYYVYDCRTVDPGEGIRYSYSLGSGLKTYIFTSDGYSRFRSNHDTSGGVYLGDSYSGSYEWTNNNINGSQTKCLVIDNVYGSTSVSVSLSVTIKNLWYKVSNTTAESSCVGSYCCFANTNLSQYIIVNHNYERSESSTETATVAIGVLYEDHFGAVVITHMVLGIIAFLIFACIFLYAACETCGSCCSSSSSSRSTYSSSSSSSYKSSVQMRTVQSVPTVRTRAGDYSAAKAHVPSSVSSITASITVIEAVSRIRPDNVEVDLSEFSRCIPAFDTEECRNARKLCDLAESGDAEAIYLFGMCFKEAIAVRRDYTRAALLFLIAAKKGNDDAVCELGVAFENGNGVDQDYSKAVILYQAAALEGCTDAMVRLGFCYLNGTGIEEDHIKAIQLWILAAAGGNKMAQAIIETIQEM